jgi:hypothetical protein
MLVQAAARAELEAWRDPRCIIQLGFVCVMALQTTCCHMLTILLLPLPAATRAALETWGGDSQHFIAISISVGFAHLVRMCV